MFSNIHNNILSSFIPPKLSVPKSNGELNLKPQSRNENVNPTKDELTEFKEDIENNIKKEFAWGLKEDIENNINKEFDWGWNG